MKRLTGLTLLAALTTSLSGCGWIWGGDGYFRDRGSDYIEARTVPPLQLPSDVEAKPLDPLLPVPSYVADRQASQGTDVPRPNPVASTELSSDFAVQRSGDLSWLVAQRIPSQLWGVTQAFFEDQGFAIENERPHLGEFSTQWVRADQLSPALRDLLSLQGSEQLRYRVRIEPGVQRNTSEVFVDTAQRQHAEDAPWSSAQRTSEQAVAALNELESFLNLPGTQGESHSLLASRAYDAPKRIAFVEVGDGIQALRLDSSFDLAWSGVGRALASANVYVDDIDRSQGVFFIDLAQKGQQKEPGFFKRLFSTKSSSAARRSKELYRVKLTAVAQQVFVSVEKEAGTMAESSVARKVLDAIQPHLN